MNLKLRSISYTLAAMLLLPLLAGCGKSEKAMQTPDGVSARDKRDQKQGLLPGS